MLDFPMKSLLIFDQNIRVTLQFILAPLQAIFSQNSPLIWLRMMHIGKFMVV